MTDNSILNNYDNALKNGEHYISEARKNKKMPPYYSSEKYITKNKSPSGFMNPVFICKGTKR